jgi:hypothetical protein
MRRPLGIVNVALCVACGGHGGISDPEFVTDSAGLETSAGTGDPEGADETADSVDGTVEVTDHCLFDPMDNEYGYKYQCGGDVVLDVLFHHPGILGFPDGDFSMGLDLRFGEGTKGDTYELPKVMACCPVYAFDAPNCGQHHERACMLDLVEQGCKTLVGSLEDFANDEFSGILHTNVRKAVRLVADHVRDHQQECVDAFRVDTGIADTPASCDEEGNGVEFGEMLETGMWSFDPPGPFSNIEITVPSAAWTRLSPEQSPTTCWSADENDGVPLFQTVAKPKTPVRHLASGNASLQGPYLDRVPVQALSPSSTLALGAGPAAVIEQLELRSDGPAEVAGVLVDAVRIRLWDDTSAAHDVSRDALVVLPGRAVFAVSAEVSGVGHLMVATNITPIVVRHGDDWTSEAFALTVPGSPWSLTVGPIAWE